jgi:hypothetical protein
MNVGPTEPSLYLISATRRHTLDNAFVERNYDSLKSLPEFEPNLSRKGIKALETYRFDQALKELLGLKLEIQQEVAEVDTQLKSDNLCRFILSDW